MTNRFASIQHYVVSLAGAFAFAALMISAAVPITPIA